MTAKLILSLDGEVIQEYPLSAERMTIGRKDSNDIVINNLAVSSQHAAIITILNDSFLEDLDSTNGLTVNGVPAKKHFLQNQDLIEIGKYKLAYLNDHVSRTSAADFEKTMIMRVPVSPEPEAVTKSGDTGYFQPLAVRESSVRDAGIATGLSASLSETGGETGQARPVSLDKAGAVGMLADEPAAPVLSVLESVAQDAPVVAAVADIQPVKTPAALLAAIQILNGPNAGKELDLVKGLTTLGKPGVQVAVLTRRPQGFFITHVEGAVFPFVNGQMLGAQPFQLKDHDLIELAGIKMEFYFK